MAVYNYLQPLTQVADLPQYQKPTWFRKKTGESTFFGDVFNTAVPALTTVAGTLLGGPLGTAIGQAAGQGIVGAVNRSESKHARLNGATDAQNQIDNDLAPDMARAGVVGSLAGLLNVNTGTPATPGTPTTAQVVNPQADVAGLGAGALDVTGMSGYQQAKNNLVNQFNQPDKAATGWQAKLGPIDPSTLPGMVQNAVVGFGKRGRTSPAFTSSYQTFAEGGKSDTATYLRYPDADKKTEDLLLVDKMTGKLHGAMRYGERIFDQKATDHIDKSVLTLKLSPSEDGFYQLGKFIFDETLTHKDHQPVQTFAEGGKPSPVNPIRQLQQLLAFNNAYTGPIHGKLDKSTLDAVYAYNKRQKNNPDAQISIGKDDNDNSYLVSLPTNEGLPLETASNDPSSFGTYTIEKSTKTPSPLAPIVTPSAPATAPLSTPTAPAVQKPGSAYNWLSPGNIADAARTFVGYTQASRDLPENPINPDYLKLVAGAKDQSTQGMGPASRQLFNNQISDSRSLGLDALRKVTGGGGSAGAVIAGLGSVNNATTDAALKLAAADEQTNLYNQQKYTYLLGGLIDQQQQRFGMGYNAALLNKQQGLNLATQGLSGIQNRYDVWNLYDNPNSALAKYAALQNENTAADTQATKNNYLSIGKILSNT